MAKNITYYYGLTEEEVIKRSDASAISFEGQESLTQQHFKDEADMNNILEKYSRTGVLDTSKQAIAQYGDFSSLKNYRDSLNTVIEAEELFNELPAQVRSEFRNDPAELIAFMGDDKNYDRALALGLLDESKVAARRPKQQVDVPIHQPVPAAGE